MSSSFLKELEELTAPVSSLPDIEDADFDVPKYENGSSAAPESGSRFIGHVDIEKKYPGEKVSRSELFGDSFEMTGLARRRKDSDSDDEEFDLDDEGESEGNEGSSEDEEEGKDGTREEGSEDGEGEEEEEEEVDQIKVDMKTILKPAEPADVEKRKGESVRAQLSIWEHLLMLNIKIHGALRLYNQLPRGALAKELLQNADEQTKNNYQSARKNIIDLLNTLFDAEEALLAGSLQTKDILKSGKASKAGEEDSDDEEIESSEDEDDKNGAKQGNGKKTGGKKGRDAEEEEMEDDGEDDDGEIPDYNVEGVDSDEDDEEDNDEDENEKGKKALGLSQIDKRILRNEARFEKFRTATLRKWDQRTLLVALRKRSDAKKDFSAFDGDIIEQIDKILSDRRRMISRTHVKRSDVERIGGNPEENEDVEIFDDDDFYHVILKDLLEKRRTTDTVDSIEMSRQWLEVEKLRQKRTKKKKVDTKASKGRKIRYTVIQKLINFQASDPLCSVSWSHEMRNELFKSLFT